MVIYLLSTLLQAEYLVYGLLGFFIITGFHLRCDQDELGPEMYPIREGSRHQPTSPEATASRLSS